MAFSLEQYEMIQGLLRSTRANRNWDAEFDTADTTLVTATAEELTVIMKALSVDIFQESIEATAEADGAAREEEWSARHEINTANDQLSAAMDVDDDDDKLEAVVGKEVNSQLKRRTAQSK